RSATQAPTLPALTGSSEGNGGEFAFAGTRIEDSSERRPHSKSIRVESFTAAQRLRPCIKLGGTRRSNRSALHKDFVQVKQHIANDSPSRKLRQIGSRWRSAKWLGGHFAGLFRRLGVRGVSLFVQLHKAIAFGRRRLAR